MADHSKPVHGHKHRKAQLPSPLLCPPLLAAWIPLGLIQWPILPPLPLVSNNDMNWENTSPQPATSPHSCVHLFLCQSSEKSDNTSHFAEAKLGLGGQGSQGVGLMMGLLQDKHWGAKGASSASWQLFPFTTNMRASKVLLPREPILSFAFMIIIDSVSCNFKDVSVIARRGFALFPVFSSRLLPDPSCTPVFLPQVPLSLSLSSSKIIFCMKECQWHEWKLSRVWSHCDKEERNICMYSIFSKIVTRSFI